MRTLTKNIHQLVGGWDVIVCLLNLGICWWIIVLLEPLSNKNKQKKGIINSTIIFMYLKHYLALIKHKVQGQFLWPLNQTTTLSYWEEFKGQKRYISHSKRLKIHARSPVVIQNDIPSTYRFPQVTAQIFEFRQKKDSNISQSRPHLILVNQDLTY